MALEYKPSSHADSERLMLNIWLIVVHRTFWASRSEAAVSTRMNFTPAAHRGGSPKCSCQLSLQGGAWAAALGSVSAKDTAGCRAEVLQ